MRAAIILCVLALTGLVFYIAAQSVDVTDKTAKIASLQADIATARTTLDARTADLTAQLSALEASAAEQAAGFEAERLTLVSDLTQTRADITLANAEIDRMKKLTEPCRPRLLILKKIAPQSLLISQSWKQPLPRLPPRSQLTTQIKSQTFRPALMPKQRPLLTLKPQRPKSKPLDAALAGTSIGFQSGLTSITAESVSLLEALAEIARDCVSENLVLDIEGHTDSAGSDDNNLLLSNGRAQAVFDFLAARDVPTTAMRAVGYGETDPIADNATSEGRAQNRRIVFDWDQR